MAQDKWLVIYDTQVDGYGQQIPFSLESVAKHAIKGGFEPTLQGSMTLVEAESEQEAASGVRKAYGDGVISGKVKVIKSSNVTEVTA